MPGKIEEQLKEFSLLKRSLLSKEKEIREKNRGYFGRKEKFIVFLSVSDGQTRACVYSASANTLEAGIKMVQQLCNKNHQRSRIKGARLEAVISPESMSLDEFFVLSTKTKKNYLRKGISFDAQFNLAFMEQEVLSNAFILKSSKKQQDVISLKNINAYAKASRGFKYPIQEQHVKQIIVFDTVGFFCEGDEVVELESGGLNHGRRKLPQADPNTVYQVIESSSRFLAGEVKENGAFTYGYFTHFYKEIKWYNMLRHASTIYSMIEAYTLTKSDDLKKSIDRAVGYLIDEGVILKSHRTYGTAAYVVDKKNDNEIKLGANGVALLALCKYTSVFEDTSYMHVMRALGRGIQSMQEEDGRFIHILYAEDLQVKEAFRIIYYDGEAAFALMRLYALDRDESWLNTVIRTFDYFIANDYWKHHDHWLSYCTNELTKYLPEDKYYLFGLKNVERKLEFIYHRETTYPTFLELLMAAHHMIGMIKQQGKEHLLEEFPTDRVYETIEKRALYQLNGYFFPETAMYMKYPDKIEGAFFIRHHSFRTRIDDIEHYLSGYYHYYTEYLGEGIPAQKQKEMIRSD